MVRSDERKVGAARLPVALLAKLSFNGSIRLAFLLVILAFTVLSIYQSAVAFRVDVTQNVGSSSDFEDGVPDLIPPPPPKEPTTTKKSEEKREVIETHLSPLQNKSNITKTLAEEVKDSKPLSLSLSSPTEKKAGNSNTIESESERSQEKYMTSASAPASAPASVPTSNLSPNPDRVFWCGYNTMFVDFPFNLAKELFPGVPAEPFQVGSTGFRPNDVLLKTRSGPCFMGKRIGRHSPTVEEVFPGKIVYVVGEVDGPPTTHERVYSLGPLPDSNKTLLAYFGAMVLGMALPENQRKIFDPQFRVRNTKKKFVLYVASNCVAFREQTFRDLSNIATAHYGGRCAGLAGGVSNGTIQNSKVGGSWIRNSRGVFQDYRFGLVMENKKSAGYITEKIVNAFLSGGTVPIWYGTREIFDVFNERAFIYYDVEDPQPALDRIIYLENNQTAYDEVQKEPILANGNRTIEDYFSFRDDVGGGKLKKRIRNMLGYQ